MKSRVLTLGLAVGLLCRLSSVPAVAQTKDYLDTSSVNTLRQFDLLDAHHKDLEEKAAGILIFPTVTKGGVALANEYGQGVLKINGVTQGYYSLAGASVGITAGMASHSEVILFMTPAALDAFLRSKGWSLDAEAGIALTYKGAADDFDTQSLRKPVLVFVFNEAGLIADLSLEGSKINKIRK